MKTLLDILTPKCIKVPLEATEKKAAIEELVQVLADAGRVEDVTAVTEAIWERERAKTTGIGLGLAIPHAKPATETKLAMAIGRPAAPIDFASIDKQPVRLIVLLSSPPNKTSDHIQTLARVSRLLTDAAFREEVYEAESAQELFDLLREREAAQLAKA